MAAYSAVVIERERAVIEADEFQFVIADASGADLTGSAWNSSLVTFAPGDLPFAVVVTGERWGPVSISTASRAAEPPLGDVWEDVVEFSVNCMVGLSVGPLFGQVTLPLTDVGGSYRVRVSARGRDDGAALTYQELSRRRREPVEEFLIEAWPAPASDAVVVRMISELGTGRQPERVALEHEAAGRAACDALRRDLDSASGARSLSGEVGSVTVIRMFPATRRALFSGFAYIYGWMTRMAGPGDAAVGNKFSMGTFGDNLADWYDVWLGSGGEIRCTWKDITRPQRVTFSWNWYLPTAREPGRRHPDWQPFLNKPSMVTISLGLPARRVEPKLTPVTITHAQLPVEWSNDMSAFWTWQLERADRRFRLGRKG